MKNNCKYCGKFTEEYRLICWKCEVDLEDENKPW